MNRLNGIVRKFAPAALTFAAASLVHAQVQPTKPPTTQPATPQATLPQNGVNSTLWFATPQARQQLNFNDNQFNGLNQAYQNAWMAYQKGVTGIDPNFDAAKRQERLNELRQNFYNDFSTAPDQYLKDPGQRKRFDQLHWQYRGYGAFSDPFVANQMKLTPAQREKLQSYQQDWYSQMNNLVPMYQKNPDQVVGQFNKIQAQTAAQINSVLTPAQQQTWQQMTGSPYTFSPDAYFPANPPGGKK
jgi:hypothetical protein